MRKTAPPPPRPTHRHTVTHTCLPTLKRGKNQLGVKGGMPLGMLPMGLMHCLPLHLVSYRSKMSVGRVGGGGGEWFGGAMGGKVQRGRAPGVPAWPKPLQQAQASGAQGSGARRALTHDGDGEDADRQRAQCLEDGQLPVKGKTKGSPRVGSSRAWRQRGA